MSESVDIIREEVAMLVDQLKSEIEYFDHNLRGITDHLPDSYATSMYAEGCASACRGMAAKSEAIRQLMEPHWYLFDEGYRASGARTAIDIVKISLGEVSEA